MWLFLVDKIWTQAQKLLLILLICNDYLGRTGFFVLRALQFLSIVWGRRGVRVGRMWGVIQRRCYDHLTIEKNFFGQYLPI